MVNINFGEVIKEARRQRNMTASQLSYMAKVAKSSLSDWENGKSIPSADAIFKLCDALGMTPSELININMPKGNIIKSVGVKIPVLGSIPAGVPIDAIEDIIDYVEISEEMANTGRYFALKVSGNSMEPTINAGDTVVIRQQEDAESGKICVVMINGNDATLKAIKKGPFGIWLLPHNPNCDFEPTLYSQKQIEELPVRILGVAVEIRRSL